MISAIVPLHNHAEWVKEAISSLQNQTVKIDRIVVVDDGSDDGSFDSVLSLMSRPNHQTFSHNDEVYKSANDDQIILLRIPTPKGPAAARNLGMNVVWESDFFCFLDSDDVYSPTKVEESLEVFDHLPFCGVVYSDFTTFRPDGIRLRQWKEPYSRPRLLQECIINCDSVVRKDAIEKAGLFDESLRVCEDYDLWLRLTRHYIAYHLPRSLVDIRVGEHSSTSTVKHEVWQQCYRRVMEKAQST